MNKYRITLSVYIIIKTILTIFIPYICSFGIFAIPFSIALGLDGGIKKLISIFILGFSFFWIALLVMSFISNKTIKSIVVYGSIVLSVIEIICLIDSIISNISTLGLSNSIDIVVIRCLAVAINSMYILFCIKFKKRIIL